jgi:PST family polysaccharide transporter
MAIAVVLGGIFTVPGAQITRDFKQDKQFISTVVSFIFSTGVLILLARHGSGALAFAWSRVIGQTVQGAILMISAKKQYLAGFSRQAASILFKFGLPLAGANFVNYILLNVDYALVGRLMGAAALGTYVLAFNVSSWPSSLLGAVINTVSMPAFSRVRHDPVLLRKAIGNAVRAVTLIAMPMCALSIALARPLVLTLYGARWIAAANVLSVLAFYGLAAVLCTLFASMLAGLGRTKALLVVQVVWLVPLVVAMALGVRQDGIVGAAVAHVVVVIPIVLPFYLFTLKRATNVSLLSLGRAALPAAVASSLAALGTAGIASMLSRPVEQLIVGGVVGGLIYLLTAAPYLFTTLIGGRASHPAVQRILRGYNSIARILGFSIQGLQPKHVRRSQHTRRGSEFPAQPQLPTDRLAD